MLCSTVPNPDTTQHRDTTHANHPCPNTPDDSCSTPGATYASIRYTVELVRLQALIFNLIMPKYTEKQLQKAINHARKDPTILRRRIAALYEVNVTTLRRRMAGTQLTYAAAHRDEQLFSPGEERAIAEHCGAMADLGFPISHDLLQKLAQDLLNSRKQPPKTKGGILVNQPVDPGADAEVHTIGVHWVDRFLSRNPEFKKRYIRYQDRSRKAASSDEESQIHFLYLLSNLIRRHKVVPQDIWNCDEKGIIIGRNQVRWVAIVRSSAKQPTMMTEGSREFCSGMYYVQACLQSLKEP